MKPPLGSVLASLEYETGLLLDHPIAVSLLHLKLKCDGSVVLLVSFLSPPQFPLSVDSLLHRY